MRIVLPNNNTTLTLDGFRFRNLAEGDNITISYVNDRTGRVNSETGVTVHERSDAEVATITINIPRYSDEDIFLNEVLHSDPLRLLEGSIKNRVFKNGEEMVETYTVEAGSITEQPEFVRNTQDGNAVMQYVIEARRVRRIV